MELRTELDCSELVTRIPRPRDFVGAVTGGGKLGIEGVDASLKLDTDEGGFRRNPLPEEMTGVGAGGSHTGKGKGTPTWGSVGGSRRRNPRPKLEPVDDDIVVLAGVCEGVAVVRKPRPRLTVTYTNILEKLETFLNTEIIKAIVSSTPELSRSVFSFCFSKIGVTCAWHTICRTFSLQSEFYYLFAPKNRLENDSASIFSSFYNYPACFSFIYLSYNLSPTTVHT